MGWTCKAVNPNVAIMVGGAPLTPEIAKHYGADGYASNAGEAVRETVSVIASMKGTQAK